MRREGRLHGMVMTHTVLPPPFDPRPYTKFINRTNALTTTTDYRTKAPFKPTNHSKFTGKCKKARCLGCHSHPVSKSRDKAKGEYKLKSCDVALNHRLVSWRVVDGGGWKGYSGISATGVLDHLSGQFWDEDGDDVEEDDNGQFCDEDGDDVEEDDNDDEAGGCCDVLFDVGEGSGVISIVEGEMDFHEVGFVVEYLDGEDWCVVREM